MGKRPRRQAILFLVEGDSERKALSDRLAAFFNDIDENIEVFFPEIVETRADIDPNDPTAKYEIGGDITQRYDVYPGNYDEKVYEYFLDDFFDINGLMPKDIIRVFQIVDMDGAYISDDLITEFDDPTNTGKPIYQKDGIQCKCKEVIARRHRRKRTVIDYLKSKETIKVKSKTIKFSALYFACNLDHFLHNAPNMAGWDKTGAAEAFSDSFIDNPQGFIDFFRKDEDSAKGCTYDESWTYITQPDSLVSLHRHTNFNLLFEEYSLKD